ncbi:MAG: kelch repeat-containing protein [Prosthecobacter sp.]
MNTNTHHCWLLLLACFNLTQAFSQNTDLPYSSGSTGADGPLTFARLFSQTRYYHAMAYDAARQQTVLFSGGGGGYTNDTWVWDGVNWTQKTPATIPPGRRDAAMAYDSIRQKVVMFGGYNGSYLNDTWEWDGVNWTQITPASSPSLRDNHAMVYDEARQRVLMFGGYSGGYKNDTWEWDGTNWTQKSPATSPSQRDQHAMAYDAARQKVILFGGVNGANETWEWNGTNWAQLSPASVPAQNYNHAMAYDAVRQRIVMFGGSYNQTNITWEWNGTNWTQRAPATVPGARYYHAMVFDAVRQKIVMTGGYVNSVGYSQETWEWNGTDWSLLAGPTRTFDMTGRANGIWNFTTIEIPTGMTINFKKNAANTPVTWLATENVDIQGTLNVSGNSYTSSNTPGNEAKGGPGGYDGGLGGTNYQVAGSYNGGPGSGPGGGLGGIDRWGDGVGGTFTGNSYLIPLVGGSGGGGSASRPSSNGLNAGAGGGAILIASSRDINVSGAIQAEGGDNTATTDSGSPPVGRDTTLASGSGSGGAIRLVADRVLGSGQLLVDRGNNSWGGVSTATNGKIRIEGYFRGILNTASSITSGTATASVPLAVTVPPAGTSPGLTITHVAGTAVAQPPTGSLSSPDVIFSSTGTVNITVTAANIPDGTPVTCRVTSGSQIINLPTTGTVPLAGGTCTFSTTVQAGVGTIQAFCNFTTGP